MEIDFRDQEYYWTTGEIERINAKTIKIKYMRNGSIKRESLAYDPTKMAKENSVLKLENIRKRDFKKKEERNEDVEGEEEE